MQSLIWTSSACKAGFYETAIPNIPAQDSSCSPLIFHSRCLGEGMEWWFGRRVPGPGNLPV